MQKVSDQEHSHLSPQWRIFLRSQRLLEEQDCSTALWRPIGQYFINSQRHMPYGAAVCSSVSTLERHSHKEIRSRRCSAALFMRPRN